MTIDSARAQAERLRRDIRHHNHLYYVLDAPEITDAEYDALVRALQRLEGEYPELVTADSPTQRVGAAPVSSFGKVQHPTAMLSLDNAMSEDEVRAWSDRVTRRLAGDEVAEPIAYVVEPKIDGVAVALTYRDGSFAQGATRGDGQVGEDITANLRTVPSVPLRIPATDASLPEGVAVPAVLEVRGEVYMPRDAFTRMNERLETVGERTFANPRNASAGSLRQLDPAVTASRPLQLLAYHVPTAEDLSATTQWGLLATLRLLGFPTAPDSRRFEDIDEAIVYAVDWLERRPELNYLADGMVFKVDSLGLQSELGAVSHHPRWAVAFKAAESEASTRLLKIDVSVGRTGRMVPHATLEPVPIGGVTVGQATLHNEDYVRDRDIREGDTVLVKRAGEVIPQVVRVVIELRPAGTKRWSMPRRCPVCGADAVREEEAADWFCVNAACSAQLVRRIEHFTSRGAMDIDGLGSKLSAQLVEQGLVGDVADLYALTADDLSPLDGFADTKTDNLLTAVEATKDRPLAKLLIGLGIRHVGGTVAGALATSFRSLEAIMAADEDALANVTGVGPEIARSVRSWSARPENLALVARLQAVGVRMTDGPAPDSGAGGSGGAGGGMAGAAGMAGAGGALGGKRLVLTGTLPTLSRSEASALIASAGGRVVGSVSGKTDYVVVGENPGSKAEKARDLGVPTLDEDALRALVSDDC